MIVTLLIVLSLMTTLSNGQTDCTKIPDVSGSGKFFNLGPIDGKEFTWTDAFSTYKFTLCKNTYITCGKCGGAGYCQFTDQWADCIGKFTRAVGLQESTGVELFYENGDWGYNARVKIICDPNVEFSNITVITGKNVQISSKYACLSAPPVTDCSKIPDTAGSGAFYDLTRIAGQQLFWAQTQTPQSSFKASVCANAFPDCGDCKGAGICQYTSTWNDCIGKFVMAVGLLDGKGVDLFYDGGDFGYAGRIRILCDPTVDISVPSFDANPFYVTVRSKHACLCSMVCVPPY